MSVAADFHGFWMPLRALSGDKQSSGGSTSNAKVFVDPKPLEILSNFGSQNSRLPDWAWHEDASGGTKLIAWLTFLRTGATAQVLLGQWGPQCDQVGTLVVACRCQNMSLNAFKCTVKKIGINTISEDFASREVEKRLSSCEGCELCCRQSVDVGKSSEKNNSTVGNCHEIQIFKVWTSWNIEPQGETGCGKRCMAQERGWAQGWLLEERVAMWNRCSHCEQVLVSDPAQTQNLKNNWKGILTLFQLFLVEGFGIVGTTPSLAWNSPENKPFAAYPHFLDRSIPLQWSPICSVGGHGAVDWTSHLARISMGFYWYGPVESQMGPQGPWNFDASNLSELESLRPSSPRSLGP